MTLRSQRGEVDPITLEVICEDRIHAGRFVIDEAPLSGLLEVFRKMMSHNGHLKTAILPWRDSSPDKTGP